MVYEKRRSFFKWWVFSTGLFSLVIYGAIANPFTLKLYIDALNHSSTLLGLGGLALALPANANNLMMINLLGGFLVAVNLLLIISSLDIEDRAWFVFWAGWIRIMAFAMIAYFVFSRDCSKILIVFGIFELLGAGIYFYYILTIKELVTARA